MRYVHKDRENEEKRRRKVPVGQEERVTRLSRIAKGHRDVLISPRVKPRGHQSAILGHNPLPFIRDDCENFIAEIKMVSGRREFTYDLVPYDLFLFALSRDRDSSWLILEEIKIYPIFSPPCFAAIIGFYFIDRDFIGIIDYINLLERKSE